MTKLQVLPPDVVTDKRRYFSDLDYRYLIDLENISERHDRLNLLFYPERVAK